MTVRDSRRGSLLLLILATLVLCLLLWKQSAEPSARWVPDYQKADLTGVLAEETLSPAGYDLLLAQTGLGKPAVDALRETGDAETILRIQEAFFSDPEIACTRNSPASWEERAAPAAVLAPLEEGDILITPCSHTFGWRNGHAAIVVDAENGRTLEAVVLGRDSSIQTVEKWERYPSFLLFRLRDVPAETRAAIADFAREHLNGIPYSLTVGILSPKHPHTERTHCSHLVWEAFRQFGYDLDSDGGLIVTPKDIANSPLLELKQVYGMDPRTLWN